MAPLGLTLYHLAARREAVVREARPERPRGRLIWLHAPGADHLRGLCELAQRIQDEDGHPILITAPVQADGLHGVIWQPVPGDGQAEVRAFLDHWQPAAILFAGGELRPAMMHEAASRHVPMALVEAAAPHLPKGREGWFPGLIKATLALAGDVFVLDEMAARAMRKAGGKATVAGRMEEPSAVLPCNEPERAALARLLATRPVWLAADVPEAEESALIEAHRAGLRLAHRLLLIVVPQDPARAEAMAARMEADEGWLVARRSLEQEPEAETEVFIVDSAEYGLWYRLSPVTFLGGSLSGTGCLRNPMEAAALGSALVHGPRPGPHGMAFGRLGAARAARSVASSADLSEALGELLAPDRAARLAQAAWTVVSDGVDVTDRVLVLVRRMLGEA